MKLMMSPASPFVRKVRVLLREIGREKEVEEIVVSTSPVATDSALAALNPVGKIPALVRDDGPVVYDSRVITRYLDAHFGAGLYPDAMIWEVLTVEANADAIMEAAVLMVYETRVREAHERSQNWVEAQWAKIGRSVAALDARWMDLLNGPDTMAHIAVACALGYLDFRHPNRDWRGLGPALAEWHARFMTRDSMAATTPPSA